MLSHCSHYGSEGALRFHDDGKETVLTGDHFARSGKSSE